MGRVVDFHFRVDVAGGWSDTPPITFEHGGCVVNLALKIDGEKPISGSISSSSPPPLNNHRPPSLCFSLLTPPNINK